MARKPENFDEWTMSLIDSRWITIGDYDPNMAINLHCSWIEHLSFLILAKDLLFLYEIFRQAFLNGSQLRNNFSVIVKFLLNLFQRIRISLALHRVRSFFSKVLIKKLADFYSKYFFIESSKVYLKNWIPNQHVDTLYVNWSNLWIEEFEIFFFFWIILGRIRFVEIKSFNFKLHAN